MKRILAVTLALLLVASVLAGCGGSGSNEGNTTAPADDGENGQTGERGVLRVGMECEFAPYNWAQSTDANGAIPIYGSNDFAFGYDVMIARYLADYIDYDLEIHRMDWDALPPAVMSGAIDAVIAGCRSRRNAK